MLILYHARKEESGLPYPQKDTLMFNLPMGITHIILLYKKLRLFFQTAVVFFINIRICPLQILTEDQIFHEFHTISWNTLTEPQIRPT